MQEIYSETNFILAIIININIAKNDTSFLIYF